VFNRIGVTGTLNAGSSGGVYGIYSAKFSSGSWSDGGTIKNCYVIATMNQRATTNLGFGCIVGRYVYNCFTRCKIYWGKASGTLRPFYVYSVLAYCYAANTMTDDSATPSTVYGLGQCSSGITLSYYDSDLFTLATSDSTKGTTTENLKSAEWLRSKGWAI
jgi:hypothetical protein